MKKEKLARIKNLIEELNNASLAYYTKGSETMSNFEYDKLYDELEALEEATGIVLANSPTQNVGYELLESLPKQRHPSKMLSLNKTKSVDELEAFIGDQKAVISWKLDGLTVVLTYRDGELSEAVTRGNGEVGEVITQNAKVFENIPLKVPYQGELIVRGEAIITYSRFEEINKLMPETEGKYKNPRNLCSGSVRQLDSKVTAERGVRFIAFSMVSGASEVAAEDATDEDKKTDISRLKTRHEQFDFLTELGFEVVWHKVIEREETSAAVEYFADAIKTYDYPSDGLVLSYDDLAYSRTLGETAKFPRDSIAFKWQDEIASTVLREMIWSASRTGLLNPIAVFDPVELEGTTVSRASVHNVSIVRELGLGIGDEIDVYKANMIIPQIAGNHTKRASLEIPEHCPVCGGDTKLNDADGIQTLHCINDDCPAKRINAFELFVSRDALNIEGMSTATIESLVDLGIVKSFADFFRLDRHKEEIVQIDGFGEKSYKNMINSAGKAANTTAERVLHGLGIPGIGSANARVISRKGGGDFEKIRALSRDDLLEIDGIGEKMADAFNGYFADEQNRAIVDDLLSEIHIEVPAEESEQDLAGMTFVITGSLNEFANRSELKHIIEQRGGKVAGSVSKNTDFLINNDIGSTSSKNKKARELGIPIISESEFISRFMSAGEY